MKIEMGESLFYSWLRHVKECQIVQTNWTTSGQWTLLHEDKLEEIKSVTAKFFSEKYGYDIYKKTASLSQLLQQAECDALGVAVQDGANKIYAVDVAFHEAGVNYGDRDTTIKKIITKCLRTAMCIYGYLDAREAEVIIGNPPYQENSQDTSDKPIYNYFMDEAYKIGEKVELISPARFLFNAGKTPKDWNKKMLSDTHIKVIWYEQNSSKVFRNTDIKGGVVVTYRDKESI